MKVRVQASGGGHGSAVVLVARPSEAASAHSSPRASVNATYEEQSPLENILAGLAGGEHHGEDKLVQFEMIGQGE
eukprot:9466667-Pyramimonas_sp.AAC.1